MSDTKACDLGIIQCFDFRSEFLTRDLKRVRPGIQSGENHLLMFLTFCVNFAQSGG